MTSKITAPKAAPAAGHTPEIDVPAAQARTELYNADTGQISSHPALATATDVQVAVSAAARAFPHWAATPPQNRAGILLRFHDLIEQHTDRLAAIIGTEHGQVLSDAQEQVIRGLEVLGSVCKIPQLLNDEFSTKVDRVALRQPLGVVAGISPLNFPEVVPMWMWMFPVTLVCGNTFVMKPTENHTTLPMEFSALLTKAGLPDGVFNVVHGETAIANALLAHPQVDAINFVASTPIEEYIHTTAGRIASILRNTRSPVSFPMPTGYRA